MKYEGGGKIALDLKPIDWRRLQCTKRIEHPRFEIGFVYR